MLMVLFWSAWTKSCDAEETKKKSSEIQLIQLEEQCAQNFICKEIRYCRLKSVNLI